MISVLFRNFAGQRRAAIVLSGCGVYDESMSIITSLSRSQVLYQCFSPNKSCDSINHTNGTKNASQRNIMEESARISRGQIKPLSELKPENFDCLFLPGGFGVAKNLSNFATEGDKFEVEKVLDKILWGFAHSKKPIGACCIAPIILAKVFGTVMGNSGLDLTLGKKGTEWPYSDSIDVASKLGNRLVPCDVDDICKDPFHNIVTTPAYMKETAKPHEVFDGISKLVAEVLKLIKS